ncbi:MAG: Ig-like domain-containing protein [Planctomycetota bacterium]
MLSRPNAARCLVLALAAGFATAASAAPDLAITDEASYQEALSTLAAAEIVRFEQSVAPNPRLLATIAVTLAFAERNPLADPLQLETYSSAVESLLRTAYPGDPDLRRPAHLLPAVRFASRVGLLSGLEGTDTDVGTRAFDLLGIDIERLEREGRMAGFEAARLLGFENSADVADTLVCAFAGRLPDGTVREGLVAAIESRVRAEGLEPRPADLASAYPEVHAGMVSLPVDYAAYEIERDGGFTGMRSTAQAEFGTLSDRIDANKQEIVDGLVAHPDLFNASDRAADPLVVQALLDARLSAAMDRATSRTRLNGAALLIAQSELAADRKYAEEAQDLSELQLEVDETFDDVASVLDIGGNIVIGAAAIYSGNYAAGIGSLLQGVGGIFGIIDGDTPAPEQQIFDQIVEVRQDIADLSNNMNERFDAIDRQLNIIYGAMVSGLNQLNETTLQIDTNVRALRSDLYALKSDLSSLEANLYGVLSAGFEQSFVEDIETALGFGIGGVDMVYSGGGSNTFLSFESRFLARGTTIAKNDVFAGPSGLTLSNDGSAAALLTSRPLGSNINNLRLFPGELQLPLWSFGRVVNPTTWAVAADAYAQLARENPWYFALLESNRQAVNDSGLERLLDEGEAVRSMMSGARDRNLFEALVGDYLGRLDAVEASLSLESYLVSQNVLPTVDPWGGLDQPMRDLGPAFPTVRVSSSDPARTPWFDTRVIWELVDSRFGLAAAMNIPSYSIGNYTLNGDTIVWNEGSPPDDTHRVSIWLERGNGSGNGGLFFEPRLNFVFPDGRLYGEVDGLSDFDLLPPAFNWNAPLDERFANNGFTEWMMRAEPGDETVIDGVRIRRRDDDPGSFGAPAPPPTSTVTNRLNQLADGYQLWATTQLQDPTVLELLDGLTSSQELIGAYLALGLPATLEQNDLVRAIVRGDDGAKSALGGGWIASEINASILENRRPLAFGDALRKRAMQLLEQIGPALDATEDEPHAYLEWSLASLRGLERDFLRLCLDDSYGVAPGVMLSVPTDAGVLVNDASQPGATSIVAGVLVEPFFGSLNFNSDGSFTYIPGPDFEGIDTFRYASTANMAPVGQFPALVTSDPATVVIRVAEAFAACETDITTEGTNPGDALYGVPDGQVTVTDLSYFVELWLANDLDVADVTTDGANAGDPSFGVPDGQVRVQDLTYFVESWIAGCP